MALQLVPLGLALGIALALGGLGALAFGVYALVRGGRDQSGGGPGGFSDSLMPVLGVAAVFLSVAKAFVGRGGVGWHRTG